MPYFGERGEGEMFFSNNFERNILPFLGFFQKEHTHNNKYKKENFTIRVTFLTQSYIETQNKHWRAYCIKTNRKI